MSSRNSKNEWGFLDPQDPRVRSLFRKRPPVEGTPPGPTRRDRRLRQQEPHPGLCNACGRVPMDGGHCGCQ